MARSASLAGLGSALIRRDVKQQNALIPHDAVIHGAEPAKANAASTNTGIRRAVTIGPATAIAKSAPGSVSLGFHTQIPANGTPRIGRGLQRIVRHSKASSNQDGGLPTWMITDPGPALSASAACPSSCARVAKGMTTKTATKKPMTQSAGLIAGVGFCQAFAAPTLGSAAAIGVFCTSFAL